MTSLDTNVANYSLSELMAIININELNETDILKNTNFYIAKYKKSKPEVSVFFKEIQSQLLQYSRDLAFESEEDDDSDDNTNGKIMVEGFSKMSGMTNDASYPAGEKQISDWYTNEVLSQSDTNQTNKITDRKQKIQTYGNEHVPMNREQISTTDTFNLPVKQDSLNPNLKNTINRFINLDSSFRQYSGGLESVSTDYTCDLSDTLKNTLKLSLYSYQIPFSWYVIDKSYGNTCFWIVDSMTNHTVSVSIPSGNYSQTDFVVALTNAFKTAGFVFTNSDGVEVLPVKYHPNNGIITLFLIGGIWTNPDTTGDDTDTFQISSATQIVFFDFTGVLQCNVNCKSKSNHYFNNTLGWLMGYRLPHELVEPNGNVAPCILDLNGSKYLILVIDDYNQNHVNNSLVSISQFSNTLKLPSYYSPDIPYVCITPAQQGNNLDDLINEAKITSLFDNTQNGLLIAGKYQNDYTDTQVVLPSAPRTLTNAQLYTINSINSNNNNLTNYLSKAPTSADILAVLPIKTSTGVPTGSLLVEYSGSLQDNTRTYFGPVNIERMAIKLLDDKGNVLNLNGNDWCITLVAECLYQY